MHLEVTYPVPGLQQHFFFFFAINVLKRLLLFSVCGRLRACLGTCVEVTEQLAGTDSPSATWSPHRQVLWQVPSPTELPCWPPFANENLKR